MTKCTLSQKSEPSWNLEPKEPPYTGLWKKKHRAKIKGYLRMSQQMSSKHVFSPTKHLRIAKFSNEPELGPRPFFFYANNSETLMFCICEERWISNALMCVARQNVDLDFLPIFVLCLLFYVFYMCCFSYQISKAILSPGPLMGFPPYIC